MQMVDIKIDLKKELIELHLKMNLNRNDLMKIGFTEVQKHSALL